jgi:hypothetical protein
LSSFISGLAAVFTLAPFLGYLTAFILMKQISGNHRKAVNTALNITTFLLIISVHFIILVIWDKPFIWVLLLMILTGTGILSIVHWRIREEIIFRKVIKGGWRLSFLIFSTAYIILLVYGIASSIANTF